MSSKNSRRLARGRHTRHASRRRNTRYLVVSNGAVTERQYFEALTRMFSEVVIEYKQKAVSPSKLAKMAVTSKRAKSRMTRPIITAKYGLSLMWISTRILQPRRESV